MRVRHASPKLGREWDILGIKDPGHANQRFAELVGVIKKSRAGTLHTQRSKGRSGSEKSLRPYLLEDQVNAAARRVSSRTS